MLVEGNSVRATARLANVSFNTVSKLLLDIGDACTAFQDRTLVDLPCETIQCDEIWSFVHAKAKNVPEGRKREFGLGDVWTPRSARTRSWCRAGSPASSRRKMGSCS
jgi:hypothetical protein